MPAQAELLLKEWLCLGAGARVGGRGRLEVLAQERHPRRRKLAGIIRLLSIVYSIVGADGRLVGSEDERGSLRNHFCEAGGALEGTREGADRVDAAYVAEGGKSVGYGGSGA